MGIELGPLLRGSKKHTGFIHARFLSIMRKQGTVRPSVTIVEHNNREALFSRN